MKNAFCVNNERNNSKSGVFYKTTSYGSKNEIGIFNNAKIFCNTTFDNTTLSAAVNNWNALIRAYSDINVKKTVKDRWCIMDFYSLARCSRDN